MVVLKLLSLLAAALLSFFAIKMMMVRDMQPVRVKANRQTASRSRCAASARTRAPASTTPRLDLPGVRAP